MPTDGNEKQPTTTGDFYEWTATNGVVCRQLGDCPSGAIRMNMMSKTKLPQDPWDHIEVHGSVRDCVAMLKAAISALEEQPIKA